MDHVLCAWTVQKLGYLQCAQAPSSPLTGILAQAFAEPSFQSRPVGVGQIEGVYHLIVNRGARLSSRAAVASLRVGLPPDARCGIHDDVVDTLGLGEHGHMA
jgi:hypothetical protein